jgi:hypothetical protein
MISSPKMNSAAHSVLAVGGNRELKVAVLLA